MGVSISDLREWFLQGEDAGFTRMLVVCDTYDHSDSPEYFYTAEEAKAKLHVYQNPLPGQIPMRVMEVYDLTADMEEQLLPGKRVWNI